MKKQHNLIPSNREHLVPVAKTMYRAAQLWALAEGVAWGRVTQAFFLIVCLFKALKIWNADLPVQISLCYSPTIAKLSVDIGGKYL